MLTFFRKIRQRLITESSASRYLLYAFGEIVLVVIGILIALQINNWNEIQKANQEEYSILQNLHENLKQAKSQSVTFIKEEEKLQDLLISALGISGDEEGIGVEDLTDWDFKELLWDFEAGLPVINTYSDIKSTGKLSLISNRVIRESFNGLELQINELNTLVYDRLTVQQIRIDDIVVDEMNFIPLIKKGLPDIDISQETPNDYNVILANPKTRNLLGLKLELTGDVLNNRKALDQEIDKLITLLEIELGK